MDSDCPQLDSEGSTNSDVAYFPLFHSITHTQRKQQLQTCVDIKKFVPLKFLLLLLLCLLSGQLGLLDLLFSLLPFLIVFHRLLMGETREIEVNIMYVWIFVTDVCIGDKPIVVINNNQLNKRCPAHMVQTQCLI